MRLPSLLRTWRITPPSAPFHSARLAFFSAISLRYKPSIGDAFHTVADALAIGCALAGYRDRLHAWAPYAALLRSRAFFLVPLAGIAVFAICNERPRVALLVGTTTVLLCVALLLDRVLTHPSKPLGRFLNLRPMVRVGVWSYALYLCQQVFLDRGSPGPCG